ncbi:hypothetical protein TNCV_2802141 [Trichonephila clavipes]|nr:hypothetical protein TNCV_2802141 [Trichonephila clavipes]
MNDRTPSSRQLAGRWTTATSALIRQFVDIGCTLDCVQECFYTAARYGGERCIPECVIERHSLLTSRAIVWGPILYRGRSNLLRIECNFNSNRRREPGEEDDISSPINHMKNLTSFTLSKYNELNGQVTLSEWTKIAPLKKSSMPNQLAHEERASQILNGFYGLENDILVLRTKNWRTLAGRRLAWKRLLEKAKAHIGLTGH